jgi:hypothetical protein
MDDESDRSLDRCHDVVTERRWEPSLRHLFGRKPGTWSSVDELLRASGEPTGSVGPDVLATWLPDPDGDPAYAVILFYDRETYSSLAAHYNAGRLLGSSSPVPTTARTGAALKANGATPGSTNPALTASERTRPSE